jgi:all-trans-retinol dehydrogenase (NAD+)
MALSEENLSRLFNVFFQGQKFVKNNVFLSIVLLYAVYAFLKNLGLLRKKHLKNQHVFITGGAMGIGRLMVKKLMILGCKVTVADMNKEALQKLQLDMKNYGTNLKTVICDVSNPENVAKAAEEARTAFGVVDILINNAGIVSGKKILDNTEQKIQ